MPGCNALLLGWLLYRSGLVPRLIPALGLMGRRCGHVPRHDPVTALAPIATAPIFGWELSLGVRLVVKGFKPSPIATGMAEPNVAA